MAIGTTSEWLFVRPILKLYLFPASIQEIVLPNVGNNGRGEKSQDVRVEVKKRGACSMRDLVLPSS